MPINLALLLLSLTAPTACCAARPTPPKLCRADSSPSPLICACSSHGVLRHAPHLSKLCLMSMGKLELEAGAHWRLLLTL